jgi:5'-methylthioadenosine phosphorylase
METGTIFLISRLRGIKAASLLILANFKGKWINYEEIYRRDSPLVLKFLSDYDENIK